MIAREDWAVVSPYILVLVFCVNDVMTEIIGLEAVWVELEWQQRKLLIGGFYIPPNSNNDYWSLLEESIDRAY